MEFTYYLIDTNKPPYSYFVVRNDTIIDSSKEIFDISVGKKPGNFLEQLFVWGRTYTIVIELTGLTDLLDFVYLIEEKVASYIPEERERTWVKLLYPTGRFGWIEYDGTEEDRFRIIKEHTDLFGIRGVDLEDLHALKVKDYKKAVENTRNKFEIKI